MTLLLSSLNHWWKEVSACIIVNFPNFFFFSSFCCLESELLKFKGFDLLVIRDGNEARILYPRWDPTSRWGKIPAPNGDGDRDRDGDRDQSPSCDGDGRQFWPRLHPCFLASGDIPVPILTFSSPFGEKFPSLLLFLTLWLDYSVWFVYC